MTYDPNYHRAYYQANKDKKREQGRIWAQNNKEKVRESSRKSRIKRKENGKDKENRLRWEAANRDKILLRAAKIRAQKCGLPFSIDISDVVIPEFCPVLGIKLNTENRKRMCPNSPSLDKIDPSLGYTRGNVWVISWRANRMKSDASPKELERFCLGMLRVIRERKDGEGQL